MDEHITSRLSPAQRTALVAPIVSTPVALILIILIGLATFGRVSRFEFTSWEDDETVAHNPLLNPPTASSLLTFWTQPQRGEYIPVTYTAWMLAANASKPQPPPGMIAPPTGTPFMPDPRVFHTLNLAVHLFAAWMVFLILRELVRADVPALAGALLFLVHPLQLEPVAWVSGMKDVLSAAFSLVALWQYIRLARADHAKPSPGDVWTGERRTRYLLATLALVLAMLSKPAAAVVPLLAVVIDLLILRRSIRTIVRALWPWFALAIVCIVLARCWAPTPADAHVAAWKTPLVQRPLVAADALAFYLYKLVWPATLTFDYGRTPQRVAAVGWRGFIWLVPLLVIALLIPLRTRARPMLAAAMISLVALLPVLGLVPFDFQTYSTVADHYFYLAMLGPALALAWILTRRPYPLALALAAIVLLVLASRTFQEAPTWRSSAALFDHARELNPSSYASYNGLAELSADAHDYVNAVQLATIAIQYNPMSFPAYMTRSGAYAQLGNVTDALTDCRKALDLAPANPNALGNYAALLANQGRYADALPFARHAVETDPRSLIARLNLASLYVALGDDPRARAQLDSVLHQDPDNAAARRLLSQLHPPPASSP